MTFITMRELMFHILEQANCWHREDIIFTLQNLCDLHSHLNSFTFFELDTIEADKHIEEWLSTSRSP